jgi:U1 small nuclear ribonucleoprotein 70kDa
MFEPGPPIVWLPRPMAAERPAERTFDGVGAEGAALVAAEEARAPETVELPQERKARAKRERLEAHRAELSARRAAYDPRGAEQSRGWTRDPWATLVVSRMAYETSDRQLRAALERFGTIRDVRLVRSKEGKPRGYAFVEFASAQEMRRAYDQANGMRIDGRRIIVDVERARTVPTWLPRRLGGGLGTTRAPRLPKGAARRARQPAPVLQAPPAPSYPSSAASAAPPRFHQPPRQ